MRRALLLPGAAAARLAGQLVKRTKHYPRYREVAERYSGSKTRPLREGRLPAVQVPIYRSDDPNCCPTGGAGRVLYQVRRTRVVRVSSRTLSPQEAGQVTPTARG
jgi:hypothetical protein